MKRVFLIANQLYDFGFHTIPYPGVVSGLRTCLASLYGNDKVYHDSRLVTQYPTGLSVTKNLPPSPLPEYDHTIQYKISGRTVSPPTTSYVRCLVDISIKFQQGNLGDITPVVCNVLQKNPGNPSVKILSHAWYSPHYPTNEQFWLCIVSEPPKVFDNIQVGAQRDFPFSFEVPMVNPLKRIPERVTATGLPSGLSISFNATPAALLGPDGEYVPEAFLPVITGSPTQEGVYTAYITASNPVGSTTTQIGIQVGPRPSKFLAVGGLGSSSAFVGAEPVDSMYLGPTKVYPYA